MTTQETAYEYHCRQFEEQYKLQGNGEDKEEFARALYQNYEENDRYLEDGTPVWEYVSYSAGIWLQDDQLVGDGGEPIHPKNPPRFMNKWTDSAKVVQNLDSPDNHADDACFALTSLVNTLSRNNDYTDGELTPEDLRPLLSTWFALTCPQYKVVLGAWNSHLNDEELEEFAVQSHVDTLQSYI
jgi:hypothetical protein